MRKIKLLALALLSVVSLAGWASSPGLEIPPSSVTPGVDFEGTTYTLEGKYIAGVGPAREDIALTDGLILNTNQTADGHANAIKFNVKEGFEISTLSFQGYSFSNDYTVSVTGVWVDGWEVEFDPVVFPVKSSGNTAILHLLPEARESVVIQFSTDADQVVLAYAIGYYSTVLQGQYIYLTPNDEWLQDDAKYMVYFFKDQAEGFSNFMTLVPGEQNLYKTQIPKGYSVIFVRLSNEAYLPRWDYKWNQTVDLIVPATGENHFTIESGSGDNYTGSWSKYDSWEEIVFTEVTAKDETNRPFNDTVFKVDDSWFKLQVKDILGKVSTSTSDCKFGSEEGYKQYAYRMSTGGTTSDRLQFKLSIPEEGKLRLAVRTGNNGDTTRYVAVEQDGQEVFHHVLKEDEEKQSIGGRTIYKYHYIPVQPGLAYLTCYNSINFYGIAFQPGAMPEPEPEPCEDKFGIMLDNDYIAGARNEAQTEYKEFVINNVRLTAGQSLQLYDSCNAAGWIIASPEYAAAGYEFNVVENKWVVSQTGSYTLYIKLTNAGDQLYVAKNIPQWEEIVFTAPSDKGSLKDSTFTAPGGRFQLTTLDGDASGKMAIDSNTVSFGTAVERNSYNYRLKPGTKSSNKNALTLSIPAQGLLRLAVRTGKNAEARPVCVIQNGDTLLTQSLNEDVQKKQTIIGEDTISYYVYYYTNVDAGTVQLAYPVNSVNFYSLAFLEDGIMPDPEPEPQPVDSVTYYAVNTIGLTAPYAYVWDAAGPYVEWPGIAMTPVNQEFRGYPIYAVTVPANMTNMVISENGSEYIKTSDMDINPATPYMYLMEWYASLDDVPAECSQTFGILVGENFIAGRQTEASQYLEYMIVAELAQGDHLKFYENCTKSAFAVAQEEGGYWFNYDQASDDYVAPATGTYTIYLKLYGVDNNVIWTSFEAPAPVVHEWEEIIFTAETPKGTFNDSTFYAPGNRFWMKATDKDNNKMATDNYGASFGTAAERNRYDFRFKTGGKTNSKNSLMLNIPADGVLRLAVRSSNKDDNTRTVVVIQEGDTMLSQVLVDEDLYREAIIEGDTVAYYHYIYAYVNAGTAQLNYPVNAINFYALAFLEGGTIPDPEPEPQPVETVTYYAVNTIGLTAPYAYVWDSVGGEYVAWPGIAMTPINQEFRGYPIYAVTVPANMTNMVISENGNQAMKTKDMALDPAKPYMYLMLWYASLDEIPGECTQSFGILVGNRFIAGELNESASYMEYIITAELNANDQIKFYESCTQSDFFVNQEEGGWWFTLDRENEVYIVPDTGTYTIYLKLYAFDNRAIYTVYQAPVVPPAPAHYYIAGTMTGWQLEELVSASSSPEMYVLIPMSEDTVEHFKVVCVSGNDTIWYGNNGTMEYYDCTNWVFDSQSDNASIHTTEVGNYAFVVTINEQGLPVVSVQIPTPSTVEMITYYAVNSIGIQIPYAYVWNADGAYVQWPGVPMQPINEEFRGYPIYAVTVPVTMDSMVINANGSDQLKTPDMALDTLKPYMYNLEWYASLDEIPEECYTTFGILVNGETFIPGEPSDGQGDYRQFDIRADLQAGDQFVLYEYCTESPFMAAQEEGGWWFDIVENHFVANASASFTIYLKIYGYDNNVIYTVKNSGSGLEETLYNDGKLHKVVEDGIIVIYRDGKRYNLQGQALR